MRMTRLAVMSLFTFCFGVLDLPLKAIACDSVLMAAAHLSTNAEFIVRAIAVSYAKAPKGESRTTGMPDSTVEFRVEEVLKGENVSTLTI